MVWGVVIIHAPGPESNALADYAARRGWEDIHVASDLAMVMRAVRAGKVEVLLASGLRGLGRSLSQLADTVRELADRGVGLCIPSLGIVDAASRQTLLNTMGCVLESKAAIATERTTQGMARAKRRGVKLGRPRILDVHRGEVAGLRAAGTSGRDIAKSLASRREVCPMFCGDK
jgi:DNA invertase Pin-like site-specific DNA recombinase